MKLDQSFRVVGSLKLLVKMMVNICNILFYTCHAFQYFRWTFVTYVYFARDTVKICTCTVLVSQLLRTLLLTGNKTKLTDYCWLKFAD